MVLIRNIMRIMATYDSTQRLQRLAAGLTARRVQLAMTQAELAEKAGIAKRTLERMENGDPVGTDNLLAVLDALQLIDDLATVMPSATSSPIQQLRTIRRNTAPRRVRTTAQNTDTSSSAAEPWQWGDGK